MVVNEKLLNGWLVTLYHPDDCDKAVEDRRILLFKKFRTFRLAHLEIEPILQSFGKSISLETLKHVTYDLYKSKILNHLQDLGKIR